MAHSETKQRFTNPFFHYGVLFLIYGVGLLTLFSHTLFHGAHTHAHDLGGTQATVAAKTAHCSGHGQLYRVDIAHDQASPENTNAQLCDKLLITNHDNVVREIAFGPHEEHVPYDGVAAKTLGRNQSFTITLNEAGLYHFHDHFHDEVSGYFSVSK